MSPANAPEAILDAWTALEVLSPRSFRRPDELAGGERRTVVRFADFEGRPLPWEGFGEVPPPQLQLYYQVVLGSIALEAASERLLARFGDSRPERPGSYGEALLGFATLDRNGRLVGAPAVTVSSFAWGLPLALKGAEELAALATWSRVERKLAADLEGQLRRARPGENELPLDAPALAQAFAWLVEHLGLPAELVKPPRFAIRCLEPLSNTNPPEPPLLNSFFLHDLAKARHLVRRGQAPVTLRRYLGAEPPAERVDLLRDPGALAAAVAPARLPPARWPGRHSLVLLQQAAVNLGLERLREGGLMAVNGPPGTGKTTLLREWVAALVAARAEAMAHFDDPAKAFKSSGEELPLGAAKLRLWRLDPKLRGFEMVVASSNNKAVENVSATLPALSTLGPGGEALRYFKTLSDTLFERTDTWGLGAAVLGNAGNRARFAAAFWWDKDSSLATYLSAAAGMEQRVEIEQPDTGKTATRPAKIVRLELPPANHAEALERWRQARKIFSAALAESRQGLGGPEALAREEAWLDPDLERRRDAVLVAAFALHRAFLDAAASRLRSNLGALISVLAGKKLPSDETRTLLPDLWASLFLVVPLVSTTFASVERMFGELPPESLGWLLIDEAGQALPQAAVGALLRSKRALVVGDPAQIEPVVPLPEELTTALCRHFAVDPRRFNPPVASAQTLADAASPVMTTFEGRDGRREVGVPLLVHRRCGEPMFGIANAVAYGGLMVSAKKPAPSPIGEALGPSAWFDVRGEASEKWCRQEGEVVQSLLHRLVVAGVAPDLYLVTPFVVVAEQLRELVRQDPLLVAWLGDARAWSREHVGTIHTVQGREAEAVILVLGAPAPWQRGARDWAGRRPNLMNVAVTRAKERLYVVGNRPLWRRAGLFAVLDHRLEAAAAPAAVQPALAFDDGSTPTDFL